MRVSAVASLLHSLGPVVVGVSLGFTLSLLCVSWTDEACYPHGEEADAVSPGQDGPPRGARKPSSVSNSNDVESEEDFEPRIVPYQQVRPSAPKKVFRQVPRLKSTGEQELMEGGRVWVNPGPVEQPGAVPDDLEINYWQMTHVCVRLPFVVMRV